MSIDLKMAEAKIEQEPSIEEILESIRQIISEDGEPVAAETGEALTAVPEAREEERTLELPQENNNTNPPEDIVVLDLVDIVEDDPIDMIDLQEKEEPVTMAIEETEVIMDDVTPSTLLSGATEDTVADTMAKLLAGNFAVERADVPGRVGNVTLEDMARDLMRPLIKSWLDQNLPEIVEKVVSREVERISRKALDR